MPSTRREFIVRAAAVGAAVAGLASAEETPAAPPAAPRPLKPEPNRGARQDLQVVAAFVRAGHGDLPKVKEMLAQDPKLVYATWDWGGGDWETALGGASHLGNRDCARYLLAQGARIDAFAAAMLGQRDVLAALLAGTPTVATTKGPHGYTLLYHVAISGDTAMADLVHSHLAPDAKDYSQALSAAVRDGHAGMVRWLFEHGTINPNAADALGRRPLTTAIDKGFTEVADELRRHGAQP